MNDKKMKTLFGRFISLHNNYKLVDIVINYFETIKSAHIALILMTEKEIFNKENFNQCILELSKEIEESNIVEITKIEYSVFSKEEIDLKFDGNYYYAMH